MESNISPKTIKALKESGVGDEFMKYVRDQISKIRGESIDPNLPAAEYKAVSIGKDMAIATLLQIIKPFDEYEFYEISEEEKQADALYYGHDSKEVV
jgi:hypothetical protein